LLPGSFLLAGLLFFGFSFQNIFLETVKIWRTALSSFFHGVLPSTSGGGSGHVITPQVEGDIAHVSLAFDS
jgi:hypothetical protein